MPRIDWPTVVTDPRAKATVTDAFFGGGFCQVAFVAKTLEAGGVEEFRWITVVPHDVINFDGHHGPALAQTLRAQWVRLSVPARLCLVAAAAALLWGAVAWALA